MQQRIPERRRNVLSKEEQEAKERRFDLAEFEINALQAAEEERALQRAAEEEDLKKLEYERQRAARLEQTQR